MAKFERVRLLGSNELPVYDLGETRRAGALSDLIEHAVLAAIMMGGAALLIAVVWWIAG